MKVGVSNFVSASAGTGKTKILIDRIIYLLLSNVKPSKILCLTFTKAASAEIKARINQKLACLCLCEDKVLFEELKQFGFGNITIELQEKARRLFTEFIDSSESLKVQTIHAFCQELLSKFPLESGLNLGFKLLDEREMISQIEESKHIMFSSKEYQVKIKEYLFYISWHLKEYSFNELLKEIINNREKLDDYFKLNPDLNLEKNLIDEDTKITNFIDASILTNKDLNNMLCGTKSDLVRANKIKNFLANSSKLRVMLIEDYFECFLTQSGIPVKSLLTKKLQQDFPDLDAKLMAEQARVYSFYKEYCDIKTKNLTQSFIVLSLYIREIYTKLKQERNVLDYDDLISLASNLLENSEFADWIRYKLDGGIDHILVDEAQDNSSKQWLIINKISEDFFQDLENLKSLFIVGDAKQSIFRFQGAEPRIFNELDMMLPEEVERIKLNKSYRSGSKILKLVDNIFNKTHIKSLVCNIETIIKHEVSKDFEGDVEIWPLEIFENKRESSGWVLPRNYLAEDNYIEENILAEKIADQIETWLNEKIYLHSKKRVILPGDILILSRRRNSFIFELIRVLHERSIPTTGIDRLKLFEHPAILDLLSLSKFILCPADDLNLAIILKSPIFNLTEDQMMSLCSNRDVTLWEILQNNFEYKNVYEFLVSIKCFSIRELFFELIENKGIRQIYLNHFGVEINDVFDSFLDIVEKFENEEMDSLQKFINFIENSNIEIQRDLSSETNKVRIMTVHAAKGLQAPIVILTDTTTLPFNDDKIIWLKENELMFPGKAKYYSESIIRAKESNFAAEYAEYLRLLYVALTRAEEKIIVTGFCKNDFVSEKSWYSIINSNTLEE